MCRLNGTGPGRRMSEDRANLSFPTSGVHGNNVPGDIRLYVVSATERILRRPNVSTAAFTSRAHHGDCRKHTFCRQRLPKRDILANSFFNFSRSFHAPKLYWIQNVDANFDKIWHKRRDAPHEWCIIALVSLLT